MAVHRLMNLANISIPNNNHVVISMVKEYKKNGYPSVD